MDEIREFVKHPSNHVHVGNVAAFEAKIQALLNGGRKSVHLISDFDMTLTKYWLNGKRSVSSHGILERYSRLDSGFKDKVAALYTHYYPLEVSHSLEMSQKVKFMEEWWSKAHELIIQQGLSKKDISLMVQETTVEFRPGLNALIDLISKENIPLLIFSAGIGDIILEILTQAKLFNPGHMHIVSNRLGWNSEGICDHFEGQLIHVFNKNESSVTDPTYKDLLLHRQNVILLGDSIGDLKMAEGVKHDTKLTIGFLNHDEDKLLNQYASAFDVLILKDSPLDFVNLLVSVLK